MDKREIKEFKQKEEKREKHHAKTEALKKKFQVGDSSDKQKMKPGERREYGMDGIVKRSFRK